MTRGGKNFYLYLNNRINLISPFKKKSRTHNFCFCCIIYSTFYCWYFKVINLISGNIWLRQKQHSSKGLILGLTKSCFLLDPHHHNITLWIYFLLFIYIYWLRQSFEGTSFIVWHIFESIKVNIVVSDRYVMVSISTSSYLKTDTMFWLICLHLCHL